MIYFIKETGSNFVKIGTTINIKSRFSGLQTSNPRELMLLGVINDGDESSIHETFKEDHVRGEWFTLSDAMKLYIDTHAKGSNLLTKKSINYIYENERENSHLSKVKGFPKSYYDLATIGVKNIKKDLKLYFPDHTLNYRTIRYGIDKKSTKFLFYCKKKVSPDSLPFYDRFAKYIAYKCSYVDEKPVTKLSEFQIVYGAITELEFLWNEHDTHEIDDMVLRARKDDYYITLDK